MRVFSDLHHSSLYNSLKILFEDRLGYELYRPVGLEWHTQGLWNVYDHPATALQYLSLDQRYMPRDGSPQLNQLQDITPDHYEILDPEYGYTQKAVTVNQFKSRQWDLVIASLPQHIRPYQELARLTGAKFIFQIGNAWTDGILPADPVNIMSSAVIAPRPQDNVVIYHQEFNIDLFKPGEPKIGTITSLMNLPGEFPDYNVLLELERSMPEWTVNIHGGQSRNGPIHGATEVADCIRDSQFIWHVKAGGDGYGHILFNSAACGVPTIVKKAYYQGKLGDKLLIDGETCIAIDNLSPDEIKKKILYYSEPERYEQMRSNVIENFKAQVSFDNDEQNVRQFLTRLV